jgi:hypothetical protein
MRAGAFNVKMSLSNFKRPAIYTAFLALAMSAVVFIVRFIQLGSLPESFKRIRSAQMESLPIPARPGTSGFTITGPRKKRMTFQVDPASSGRRLIWSDLLAQDPTADIRIEAEIEENGLLRITKHQFSGHNEIGQTIIDAMTTWRYFPYKQGRIRFWYNLASLSEVKLELDASRLNRNQSIPAQVPVDDGLLYWIDGIPRDAVQ